MVSEWGDWLSHTDSQILSEFESFIIWWRLGGIMPGWRPSHKHSMDGKVSCGLRSVPSAASPGFALGRGWPEALRAP